MRIPLLSGMALGLLVLACADRRDTYPTPQASVPSKPPAVTALSAQGPHGGLAESFEAPAVPFADYPGEVLQCGGEVAKPVRVFWPLPAFPPERSGLTFPGVVVAQGIIDKNGDIARLRIDKSFHPSFDASVLAAMQQWKFKPAVLHGRPVDVWYRLTVNFVLAQRPAA